MALVIAMQVHIKSLNGQYTTIQVNPGLRVNELGKQVKARLGLSGGKVQLIFQGK